MFKRVVATTLALVFLVTSTVFAQNQQPEEQESLSYVEFLLDVIERGLGNWRPDPSLVRNRVDRERQIATHQEQRRTEHERQIELFLPNYVPGTIVDAHLIGEDGRPIEIPFGDIQQNLVQDLPMEHYRFSEEIFATWFYHYEGMTTLERAIMDAINEFRAEHNLQPFVHDPTLSVGARFRAEYFRRNIGPGVSVGHEVGTIPTGPVGTMFSPLLTNGALLVPGFARSERMDITYVEIARPVARNRSPIHTEGLLSRTHTHIGVGVSHRAIYVFIGSH